MQCIKLHGSFFWLVIREVEDSLNLFRPFIYLKWLTKLVEKLNFRNDIALLYILKYSLNVSCDIDRAFNIEHLFNIPWVHKYFLIVR